MNYDNTKVKCMGRVLKQVAILLPNLDAIDEDNLKEELVFGQHFLVDSHVENRRQRIFNFALDSFSAEKINSKLDYVFQQLKCAAKIYLAFGYILKNLEDASCCYFYAHENNTLLEKFKLLSTGDELEHIKTLLAGKDVIEPCAHERVNTKWKFLKLTKVTIFAALLKDIFEWDAKTLCCLNL